MWHPILDHVAHSEGLDGFFDGPVCANEPDINSSDLSERRDAEWIQRQRKAKFAYTVSKVSSGVSS
jgi:hypothetical protein